MLKTDPGENVGDKSAFLVSHYIGNENSTDVLSQSGSSPIPNSDISKMKNVKINWGGLLKVAPTVIGHVVQIGITIASVVSPQDGDKKDMQGLAVSCYDAASAAVQPLVADIEIR